MKNTTIRSGAASRLVYSTETGRACPACSHALSECVCKARAKAQALGDGTVRVSRQTKGRGGKSVTVVKGLALEADALASLGKQLRTGCGAGGTVKDGIIEVQGDHAALILDALLKQGYKARLVGG